nr:hypothetical protein [uncultured Ottowia sp.]
MRAQPAHAAGARLDFRRDRWRTANARLHARFAIGGVAYQLAASFDWQHE